MLRLLTFACLLLAVPVLCVLGSWLVAGRPCGLSIREDASPVTKNTSRFLPHAILG